jgi:hypothetical protein
MKKTRSKNSRDTVPLKTVVIFEGAGISRGGGRGVGGGGILRQNLMAHFAQKERG